ncbi:MAG: hypothetical protein ABSF12_15040 [Bryobacteraceae bacterium]
MFSDKIDDTPASVTLLKVCEFEGRNFRSPKSAAKKNREDGTIAQTANLRDIRRAQQRLRLSPRQPVPDTNASRFHALDAADSLGQLRREQPVVRRLRRQLANSRHSNDD